MRFYVPVGELVSADDEAQVLVIGTVEDLQRYEGPPRTRFVLENKGHRVPVELGGIGPEMLRLGVEAIVDGTLARGAQGATIHATGVHVQIPDLPWVEPGKSAP